jgi:very-short-patch-repair endonuclease
MASPLTADAALTVWQRQLHRRRQGVPTLSVVSGSGDTAQWLVRHWSQSNQLGICETSGGDRDSLADAWFASLAGSRNLFGAALAWLSVRADQPVHELAAALAARSETQQSLYLERMFGAVARGHDEHVCRAIIEHQAERGSTTAGLWERLHSPGQSAEIVCGGLLALVGEVACPVLYALPPARDALRTTLEALTRLVLAAPGLVAFISADSAWLERYLIESPESRTSALVREGLVTLDTASKPVQSAAEQVASGGADDVTRLRMGTLRPGLAAEKRPADRARSEAERYLFHRLQNHPETQGVFELNGRLELADGASCEVDLLGRGVRVAIEIDGYYHFTDLDAYRRDRRKDVSLQQAGYLVLRCLADDVVSRLEDIVSLVLGAVRSRRSMTHRWPSREEPTP